ncbi:MAG: hypothetical protein D6718_07290, partial [Acidobacteria bacterium]
MTEVRVQAIELNLATRPYRNDKPLAVALLVLGAAALAFTGHNAHAYLTADAREAALLEELAGHRQRMASMTKEAQELRKELAAIDMEALAPQAYFVQSIMEERHFSWTRLFGELERVLPWNVRVTSVRPTFESGVVRVQLRGIAKDDDAYFHFQEVLQDAPAFNDVVPGDYQYAEGTDEVAFFLTFRYTPQAEPPAASEQQLTGAPAEEEPVEVLLVEGGAAEEGSGEPAEGSGEAAPAAAARAGGPAPSVSRSPAVPGAAASAAPAGGGSEAEAGGGSRPGRERRSGPRRRAERTTGSDAGAAALLPGRRRGGRAGKAGARGATSAAGGASASSGAAAPAGKPAGNAPLPPGSGDRITQPRPDLVRTDEQGHPKWINPKVRPGARIQGAREAIRAWEEGRTGAGQEGGSGESGSSGGDGSGSPGGGGGGSSG